MNRAWWFVGVAGRIIIVLFVALVGAVFSFPFFASLPLEFVDLSGEEARSRLRTSWSEDLELGELEKASGKVYSQIDSHARWFRITLRPEAAEKWQQAIHAKLEDSARGGEFIEGVHRTVKGPLLTTTSLGKPPKWWLPPPSEFRVTERMRWGGSTYANVVHSLFDPSTNTLWIYDYGQQHGQLWSRGSVPSGVQFASDQPRTHGGR